MYLFLVEYNYISSEHLQKMIGQVLPEVDVVHCFSPATLLKISEKLNPELVIIDFELVEEGKVDLIETLREKCPEAYVLALIEPDYYEQLYQAIEKSLVDDYIVKPVTEDEFAARILITTRRKRPDKTLFVAPLPEQLVSSEGQATIETDLLEEPDVREAAASEDSLFEESAKIKSAEPDIFTPPPEEDFPSKIAEENYTNISLGEPDLEIPDQNDQVDQADDLFSERFSLLEEKEPTHSFTPEENLEGPKSEEEPGEDYFNDLFLEQYDPEEETDKTVEPDSLPPGRPVFEEFDDASERDINISIKDFMPGESADQYLKEKEAEEALSFKEDLLDRFLGDEEEDESDEEDHYDEHDESSGLARFFSVLMNIILALLLLMMASLSFFLIHNRVADGPPRLAGFTFHVMQEDALNADVNPGSLAVVRDTDVTAVSLGDIINFRIPISPNATATQRVVEINRDERLNFVTSGDGDGAVQTTVVPAEDVLGKVLFSVPFYGKMVDYVQTSQGLILLIFVPGVIIIVYQLIKIIRHLSGSGRSDRSSRYREIVEEE